jgi:transposase
LADVEIIARVERRRKWTAQEKAALLAEVEAEGGKVTIVARRHQIAESVLYNWRAAWKAAATAMPGPRAPTFMPVGLLAGSDHRDPTRPLRANHGGTGEIEIVLPNGARLSVDASVNEKALSRVLRAMKDAS